MYCEHPARKNPDYTGAARSWFYSIFVLIIELSFMVTSTGCSVTGRGDCLSDNFKNVLL